MLKKLLVLALIAIGVSGCNRSTPQSTQLDCTNPLIQQSINNNIQEAIKQQARIFAQNDARQLIDADKIIAAGSELQITLNQATQENNNGTAICSGQLSIQIPSQILNTAQTNSPLIYGDQTINQLIQQNLDNHLSYNGTGLLTSSLRYTPSVNNNQITSISYENNNIPTIAKTLSTILLPYGVKSIIVIDGQAVSINEALRLYHQPADSNEIKKLSPEDILNHNAASSEAITTSTPPTSQTPSPEILTPQPTNQDNISLSSYDLEQARNNNRNANTEINNVWNRMDGTIQQSLLNEQRSWIKNKNNSCLRSTAQASTNAQAEYLQLQCDTRMTRERIQYLRGFVIN